MDSEQHVFLPERCSTQSPLRARAMQLTVYVLRKAQHKQKKSPIAECGSDGQSQSNLNL